jgi:hypothetical protein
MGTVLDARTLTPVDGATVEVYREGSLVRTAHNGRQAASSRRCICLRGSIR